MIMGAIKKVAEFGGETMSSLTADDVGDEFGVLFKDYNKRKVFNAL